MRIMKGGNLPTCATWTACYRCHRFCFVQNPGSFVSLFTPLCLDISIEIVSSVLLWGIQSPHWLPMELCRALDNAVVLCNPMWYVAQDGATQSFVILDDSNQGGKKTEPRNNKERWKGSSFSLPDNVIWTRVSPFKYPWIADQKMMPYSFIKEQKMINTPVQP